MELSNFEYAGLNRTEPSIGPEKKFYERKIVIISLPFNLNMCFDTQMNRLIETFLDGSFEYPRHMFWMRNEENRYQIILTVGLPGG